MVALYRIMPERLFGYKKKVEMMARVKDSYKSKMDILAAAEQIFSEKGLYGTRVDKIAVKANINKRIYTNISAAKPIFIKAYWR